MVEIIFLTLTSLIPSSSAEISVYIKDDNTQQSYAEPVTRMSNISSYTLGDSGAAEITVLMPKMLRQ